MQHSAETEAGRRGSSKNRNHVASEEHDYGITSAIQWKFWELPDEVYLDLRVVLRVFALLIPKFPAMLLPNP